MGKESNSSVKFTEKSLAHILFYFFLPLTVLYYREVEMPKHGGCPSKSIHLMQSLTNFSGATIVTSKPTAYIFYNKFDAIKKGWVDSLETAVFWATTSRARPRRRRGHLPPLPPRLLRRTEETPRGRSGHRGLCLRTRAGEQRCEFLRP